MIAGPLESSLTTAPLSLAAPPPCSTSSNFPRRRPRMAGSPKLVSTGATSKPSRTPLGTPHSQGRLLAWSSRRQPEGNSSTQSWRLGAKPRSGTCRQTTSATTPRRATAPDATTFLSTTARRRQARGPCCSPDAAAPSWIDISQPEGNSSDARPRSSLDRVGGRLRPGPAPGHLTVPAGSAIGTVFRVDIADYITQCPGQTATLTIARRFRFPQFTGASHAAGSSLHCCRQRPPIVHCEIVVLHFRAGGD